MRYKIGRIITHPPVGEAISLPRVTTLQNGFGSGKFVQIPDILPFNQPLRNHNEAGGW